jgi:hypothetical protein
VRNLYDAAVTPIFFDPHICKLSPTADFIGREMEFECACGTRPGITESLVYERGGCGRNRVPRLRRQPTLQRQQREQVKSLPACT